MTWYTDSTGVGRASISRGVGPQTNLVVRGVCVVAALEKVEVAGLDGEGGHEMHTLAARHVRDPHVLERLERRGRLGRRARVISSM